MLNEFSVKLLKFDQIFMCLNNSHDLLVVNPKPFKGIDNEVINKIRELISASSLGVHLMAWRYSEIDFVPCWERITCSSNAWFVIWRLYNLVSFCDASYDAQVDVNNDITALQRERKRERERERSEDCMTQQLIFGNSKRYRQGLALLGHPS